MQDWTPGDLLNEDKRGRIFHALSSGFLDFIMDAHAAWISSPHSDHVRRYKDSVKPLYVSALASPQAKTIEKLIPMAFWGGETAQDEADSVPTALSVNGISMNPQYWPNKTLRQVASFIDSIKPYEVCKEDVSESEADEVIEFATALLSMGAALEAELAEDPEAQEDIEKTKAMILRDAGRMEKVEQDAKKAEPYFERMLREEYYDEWWRQYGEKSIIGDQCVVFDFITEMGIWTKK